MRAFITGKLLEINTCCLVQLTSMCKGRLIYFVALTLPLAKINQGKFGAEVCSTHDQLAEFTLCKAFSLSLLC